MGGRGHTLLVKLLRMCLKLKEFQTLMGKVPFKVSFLWWGYLVTVDFWDIVDEWIVIGLQDN